LRALKDALWVLKKNPEKFPKKGNYMELCECEKRD
jgi:hypothetical protein